MADTPAKPTITGHPETISASSSASFSFSGDGVSGHKFQCQLDGSDYSLCSSGISYTGLSSKVLIHTFRVRGKHGNEYSAEATFTWTVTVNDPVTGTMTWDGHQGLNPDNTLGEEKCGLDREQTGPYLHWILNGVDDAPYPDLYLDLGGSGSGSIKGSRSGGSGTYHFYSGYFDLASLTAHVDNVPGGNNLVISHGCSTGRTEVPEFPTIALPIAAVIGLVFFFQNRKKKQE